MTRRRRVIIELLGPPFVAAFLFWALELAGTRDPIFLNPKGILFILCFAYLFALGPSILCAIVMEVFFARGLRARSTAAVVVYSSLGLLSGLVIALAWMRGLDNRTGAYWLFPVLGMFTGMILGLVVKTNGARLSNQSPEPTP